MRRFLVGWPIRGKLGGTFTSLGALLIGEFQNKGRAVKPAEMNNLKMVARVGLCESTIDAHKPHSLVKTTKK